jgi:hypothetical protein
MTRHALWIGSWFVASATAVGACKGSPSSGDEPRAAADAAKGATSPSAASSHSVPIPVPAASVEAIVNPTHLPPYAGPTGAVEGKVRVKGDAAPASDAKVTPSCAPAAEFYAAEFREGPERALPDVMVAVTEYAGYVPAREPAVRVSIKDCAFNQRTIVAAFGQRIEVTNLDDKASYIPYLVNEPAAAHMVAPPHSDAVKLYPLKVGRFLLADEMNRRWMQADVLVVKYATHAVTGIQGHYRIEGIPVGNVKVSAYLPSVELVGNQSTTIESGKTATVDFELQYNKPPPKPAAPKGAKEPKEPVVR